MPNYVPTLSSDEVYRGEDLTRFLSQDLDSIESGISDLQTGKADVDHTHTGYAASDHTHTEYAASDHTHTGYATSDHTHTEYAASDHTHTGFAASSHTHEQSEISGLTTALSGKADSSHTHSGYASSSHTHTPASIGAASADHTHTPSSIGAASSSHTHTPASIGAATSSHNHDSDYLPASGDVNVAGVLRVQSQQAFYYDTSGAAQTVGTNNATGGTTICCGSSADATINGANLKAANVIPRNNGNFTLGTSSYRWKGIYSTVAVNVSSDRRLKRDIEELPNTPLANFVDRLKVVSYNYKEDPEEYDPRIGLIAQDVQEADPEIAKFFVHEDENGMLNLTTADLVFALISTVQELRHEIDILKSEK